MSALERASSDRPPMLLHASLCRKSDLVQNQQKSELLENRMRLSHLQMTVMRVLVFLRSSGEGKCFNQGLASVGLASLLQCALSSPTVCICFVARWQVDAVWAKA